MHCYNCHTTLISQHNSTNLARLAAPALLDSEVTRLQLYPAAGEAQGEGEYPDDELASHYGENGASQTGKKNQRFFIGFVVPCVHCTLHC
jgi:hypothetical protein